MTSIVSAPTILKYLDKYIRKFPKITFHVHASPSCRALSSS